MYGWQGGKRSDRRNWEIGMTHKTLLSATVPRWVDKKSGIPKEGKGSGVLKEEERTSFFSLHSLVLVP